MLAALVYCNCRKMIIMTVKLRVCLPKYMVVLSSEVSFSDLTGSSDYPFDDHLTVI